MSGQINVIIGAGQAGGYAAIAMREAGFAGRILLIGEEAERPYERPPLSKQMLTEDPEPPVSYFHAASRYAECSVELLSGTTATAIAPDRHEVRLHDGTRIGYHRLLLATGGRARRLGVPGGEHALTLRTIGDARRIRGSLAPGRRVVCIGAGVIGLEIASSARTRGCVVTVLEAAPGVMGRCVSPQIAAWIERLHREAGVDVRLNAAVTAIEPGRVLCGSEAIAADVVIAGIGMERNVALAAEAGLTIDGGIVVDAFGRTSAPDIYAAGDVAAFWLPRLGRRVRLESWHHAQDHGIAIGRVMADVLEPYDPVPWFWTDQHGMNIQVAGSAEGAARSMMRGDQDSASFSVWHMNENGAVIGVEGVNAPRDVRAGQAMIRAGRPADASSIADTGILAQRLVRMIQV